MKYIWEYDDVKVGRSALQLTLRTKPHMLVFMPQVDHAKNWMLIQNDGHAVVWNKTRDEMVAFLNERGFEPI